jgi:tyrosinase
MGAVNKAANDPVFWLHHANVDRLWEAWLRKCNGRTNPTDATWLNKTYTFFDENGTAVNMTASQVISTAASLNYRYDFPVIRFPCVVRVLNPDKWRFREFNLLRKPINLNLTQKSNVLKLQEMVNDTIMTFVQKNKIKQFNFSTTGISDQVLLKLDDIQVTKLPEGVVEVYLNLPAGQTPNPDSKYFVGVLDLFSTSMAGMHHDNGLVLDASRAVQAQGLPVAAVQAPQLTFFIRGNTVNGKETVTATDMSIHSTNFAIRFAQK